MVAVFCVIFFSPCDFQLSVRPRPHGPGGVQHEGPSLFYRPDAAEHGGVQLEAFSQREEPFTAC